MNLNDLYKLAGIQRDDTPAIEPVEVEQQVAEQPMDGREDMKAMIALIDPEVLNKLGAEAPVEEEGYANSSDHYSGEPEEYKGTLGSPADLSLRRYLGANGMPVNVDETKVYKDHKVEDITEAWQAYKADPVTEAHACGCDDSCACGGNCGPNCNCHSGCSATNESVEEAKVEEEPNEGNAFTGAMAGKKKGEKFTVGDKTFTKEQQRLAKLAGVQVDEAPFPGEFDYTNSPQEDEEIKAIMMKHPEEAKKLKATGDIDMDSQLYMDLYSYYLDSGEMPYGTAKARDGDPVEWILDRLDDMGMPMGNLSDSVEQEAEVVQDENIDMLKKLAGI